MYIPGTLTLDYHKPKTRRLGTFQIGTASAFQKRNVGDAGACCTLARFGVGGLGLAYTRGDRRIVIGGIAEFRACVGNNVVSYELLVVHKEPPHSTSRLSKKNTIVIRLMLPTKKTLVESPNCPKGCNSPKCREKSRML
jgi:hypothetical protein